MYYHAVSPLALGSDDAARISLVMYLSTKLLDAVNKDTRDVPLLPPPHKKRKRS